MAAAAAAALAATDSPPAMPQAAGAGGPAARRDFYWLRSFLAGGIAGCCAKTTVAPLDRVKVLLQAHNHHYKHLGAPAEQVTSSSSQRPLAQASEHGVMSVIPPQA